MPYVTSPLNKDYSFKEGHDEKGKLNVNPADLSKVARLKRKRGRFRIPDGFQQRVLRVHYHDTPYTEDEITTLMNRYYEDVEVTEDTVRNPYSKLPQPSKGKIVDDGGEFTHYTIRYTNPVTASVNIYTHVETAIIQEVGHLWLDPIAFWHLGREITTSIEPPEEDLDLSELGPRMWRTMSPTNPTVDLGVALAEIRDLPRLIKGKLDSMKNLVASLENPQGLADWLLAVQFGWKPLMSDIRGIIKAYHKIEDRIEFLMRNGGQPLHRKLPTRTLEPEVEVLYQYEGPDDPGWMTDKYPEDFRPDEVVRQFTAKVTCTTRVTETATGIFTYHLGEIPPTPEYLRAKLLGLIFNEALLWDASPWTWLVDWFTNIADVIHNVQMNIDERVVSLYAYSQRQVVREYTFECSNEFYRTAVTRVFDTKCRRKIDPFGLAAEAGLSDLQYAILIALGLTRV